MSSSETIRVTVDAVVFGYDAAQGLQLLLIRRLIDPWKGHWALPGGFVLPHEDLEQAVLRELREETGVRLNYLEQLYTYGKPGRDPRGRVVSIAYYGLAVPGQHTLQATTDAAEAAWYPVSSLPPLAFDHAQIADMALQRLRAKLRYQPIGFGLLPRQFRFSELERLYSVILGRDIDRRNFKKKVMSYGIIEEAGVHKPEGRGRPGVLYQFSTAKYEQLQQQGFYFEV